VHFLYQPARNLPRILVRQKLCPVLQSAVISRDAIAIADDNRVAALKKPMADSD